MRDNGIRRAAVFTTSAWGGYSSCTQYNEDIARGRAAAGAGAPELVKLRQYFDHPLLVEMFAEAIADAAQTPARRAARPTPGWCSPRTPFRLRPDPVVAPTFTPARSAYASRLVATEAGYADYDQVWQSRSGPPQVPWLEPDVADHLSALAERAPRPSSSARSASSPTTSRWCGIWTTSCAAQAEESRHRVRPGAHPQCRPPLRPAGGRPDRRAARGPRTVPLRRPTGFGSSAAVRLFVDGALCTPRMR